MKNTSAFDAIVFVWCQKGGQKIIKEERSKEEDRQESEVKQC